MARVLYCVLLRAELGIKSQNTVLAGRLYYGYSSPLYGTLYKYDLSIGTQLSQELVYSTL